MNSKYALFLILFTLLSFGLKSQVKISLKDKEDQNPIPFALIDQQDQNVRLVSDQNGFASIDLTELASSDSILIKVSHISYKNDTFYLPNSDTDTILHLEKNYLQLDEVRVTPLDINLYLEESYAKTVGALKAFSIAKASYFQEFKIKDKVQSQFKSVGYYLHSGDIKSDKYLGRKDILLFDQTKKLENEGVSENELDKIWSYLFWEIIETIYSDENYNLAFGKEHDIELDSKSDGAHRVFTIVPNNENNDLFDRLAIEVQTETDLITKLEVINFNSTKPMKSDSERKWQQEEVQTSVQFRFSNTEDKFSLVHASMQSEFKSGIKFRSEFNVHAIPLNFELDRKEKNKWEKIISAISSHELNPRLGNGIDDIKMIYFKDVKTPDYLVERKQGFYNPIEDLRKQDKQTYEYLIERENYVRAFIDTFTFFD